MLFLTRKIGQKIMINDDIIIKINDIYIEKNEDFKVCVGISAPYGIKIFREEIWFKIKQDKKSEKFNESNF